ncbi:transposase [Streptomyces sp. NPDC058195]|uniref:transposase n=1 Tax=Streptomyces sp. NPDC058195 TaxID=3346375 RepID=UPI0036E6395B
MTGWQRDRVRPVLPSRTGRRGRPWAGHRHIAEAVAHRYRTGTPWRDGPAGFATPAAAPSSSTGARPLDPLPNPCATRRGSNRGTTGTGSPGSTCSQVNAPDSRRREVRI